MRKTEKAVLIEGLRKLSADAAWIADALEGKTKAETEVPAEEPVKAEAEQTEAPTEQPEQAVTFEAVRALLAEKARAGFKAEIKALLTSHGVEKLSQITDPEELAKVMQEAQVVGNG